MYSTKGDFQLFISGLDRPTYTEWNVYNEFISFPTK